ncbi:MAG: DUF3298 domain-containing protein [Bacteroidales bacterium]
MHKKVNWKLPLLIVVTIGIYYIYDVKFSGPKGPFKIDADSVVFKRGCASSESACLKLKFVFPSVTSDGAGKVTKKLFSDYLQMLEDSVAVSTMNEFKSRLVDNCMRFDSSYQEYVNEFPDDSYIAWYLDVNFDVLRNDGRILTLKYLYSDYMGGAHGMYNYHYQNFDVKKSRFINLDDVFESKDGFVSIAKAEFVNKFFDDQTSTVRLNTSKDEFSLPREFGFGDKGLILHYNVYEIASYAEGDIVFEIPYAKLNGVLKPDWKYLLE